MSTPPSSPLAESWISSFCSLLGHEYFAEVSEDFIEDDFNLTGLSSQVPMYKEALEMILDVEPEEEDEDISEEEEDEEDASDLGEGTGIGIGRGRGHKRGASDLSLVESSAELLYGLVHARYINSRPGLTQMAEKYSLNHFGVCPRVYCHAARVLPVGLSDTPGVDTVKLFCPSCLDVYAPPNSRFQSVDGAFFGTTFGWAFLGAWPDLEVVGTLANTSTYGRAGEAAPSPTETIRSGGRSKDSPPQSFLPPQPTMVNGVITANLAPGLGENNIYRPRIYGFQVSERSRTGPRMQWLRMKPRDLNELDETRRFYEENGDKAADVPPEDRNMVERDVVGDAAGQQRSGTAASRKVKKGTRRRKNDTTTITNNAKGEADKAGAAALEQEDEMDMDNRVDRGGG